MKVYMSVDMEGISGIVKRDQVAKGTREYEEARYLLIRDTNAAVDGALEAGADEVVVVDAHATGFNFPLEELHPGAKFIFGTNASTRFPFLDASYDLGFLVGYHAMAGTEAAVLDHTYSSVSVQRMIVNGVEMGEVGIDALRFGHFGVPVALVTGDDKVCAEARSFFGEVETAVVKYAVARQGAMVLAPKKGRELVKAAAFKAVKRAGDFSPYMVEGPYTVEIDYLTTEAADSKYVNGVDRIRVSPKRVVYKTDNVLDIFVTMP